MRLEDAFEASWTLRALRSAPLGALIGEFCEWLGERGFPRSSLRRHLGNILHLNAWFGERDERWTGVLRQQDLDTFLQAYRVTCRNRGPLESHLRCMRWSLSRFVGFLAESGRFDRQVEEPLYQSLIDGYLNWMKKYRHAAGGTLGLRRSSVEQFLQGIGEMGSREGISRLRADRVESFFLAYAAGRGRASRRSMQAALRTFLMYCRHERYIENPLDLAVPPLRTYRLSRLPRGLSETQARRVLASIDRRTPAGCRDYAILMMLHTYGVRGCQLRALRLEDVHWSRDEIVFRAAKGGRQSVLPLTGEVGGSLLDYLRSTRPQSVCDEVFLTCRAPFHAMDKHGVLSGIVRERFRAAGIDMPCGGSHAFRHAFATRMVAGGNSLKTVADLLGHRHLSTTFIYTKVDFKQLSQVALAWPEEAMS